jgi:ubiquinone/menaquinone biosynthesis C-methylase UbiE
MSDSQAVALRWTPQAPPEPLTAAAVEDAYYEILAGGARYALFCSLVDMNVLPLVTRGPVTADEIVAALGLDPLRGRKWVHLLQLTGFLGVAWEGQGEPRYFASELMLRIFGGDGAGGWFHREFLRYYRSAAYYGMSTLLWTLRGSPVEYAVRYPPQETADVELLHQWMRHTALGTLASIERYAEFARVSRLLDVAGGDGTMALELWRRYPHLHVTVFNVPAAAELARQRVEEAGAGERIRVVAGDFRMDPFPGSHDAVMFSRVLADWPAELCRELLRKAHAALDPGGRLIICEPLADENPALAVAWEQSYLPYDDFGVAVYKPLSAYQALLEETGFRVMRVHPRDATTIHCVILAERE